MELPNRDPKEGHVFVLFDTVHGDLTHTACFTAATALTEYVAEIKRYIKSEPERPDSPYGSDENIAWQRHHCEWYKKGVYRSLGNLEWKELLLNPRMKLRSTTED